MKAGPVARATGRRWCRVPPMRPKAGELRAQHNGLAVGLEGVDGRVLVDLDAKVQTCRAQAPREPGRVEKREALGLEVRAEIGGGVDEGPGRRPSRSSARWPWRWASLTAAATSSIWWASVRRSARRLPRTRTRCRSAPASFRFRTGSPCRAARGCRSPRGSARRRCEAVREACRAESAVAAGRLPPAAARSSRTTRRPGSASLPAVQSTARCSRHPPPPGHIAGGR